MGMNQIRFLVYLQVESIQKLSYGNLIKYKTIMILKKRLNIIMEKIINMIL